MGYSSVGSVRSVRVTAVNKSAGTYFKSMEDGQFKIWIGSFSHESMTAFSHDVTMAKTVPTQADDGLLQSLFTIVGSYRGCRGTSGLVYNCDFATRVAVTATVWHPGLSSPHWWMSLRWTV